MHKRTMHVQFLASCWDFYHFARHFDKFRICTALLLKAWNFLFYPIRSSSPWLDPHGFP